MGAGDKAAFLVKPRTDMLSLLSLFATVCVISANLEIFDSRSYVCRRTAVGIVDCRISFDGNEEWDAINDNGCYQEADPTSEAVVEYCPLQCPDAPRAYLTENPSVCDSDSFGVIRRKNDWFLWRSEPCDGEETVFRIACTRPGPAKKHPKMPMQKKEQKVETPIEEVRKPVEVKNTVAAVEEKDDDTLPQAVDALLRAMFPSYRKQ